ncbi:MAG: flagellar biosynthesis protein FlhA [Spirochaetes bacterium]|nr:flagellar biosynthesis protein FlhA [Spirochaetota bacterium]
MADATTTANNPFGFLPKNWLKNSDMLFAVGAILVIVMLIIPLPAILLDMLLIVDIVVSLLILLMVLNLKSASEFSVFPQLLLVMTAFRLALNVSATRLILTQGINFKGRIIGAFGDFVIGGNIVVGVLIFVILIIVQFMVITKGATRVAEVAARFALDSMPPKMLAVDSELNAGAITEKEANERRLKIRQESDFYGTMDGASKFVQGDVIAGIIITIINILGGFIIGMAMRGESLEVAAKAYTRFTVGDGIVTQIPAFFMSFATGLLVTRSASEDNLGKQVIKQLLIDPRNLFIAAGFAFIMAWLPGFPTLILLFFSIALGFLAWNIQRQGEELGITEKKESETAARKGPVDVSSLLKTEPIELSIGANLIPLVDETQGGDLLNRVTNTRRELALEMGMVVPPVRITDNAGIEPEEYVVSINGTEMAKGSVRSSMLLAINQRGEGEKLEGEVTREPAFGLPAYWISYEDRDIAEKKGFMIFSPTAVIATHLTEIIKRNAMLLLGRQEVQKIVDVLKETHPALVQEVMGKPNALGYVQKVMQQLLGEGISIRNTVVLLESVADAIDAKILPEQAAEVVRQRMSHQISKQVASPDGIIRVITLSQAHQEEIGNNVVDAGDGRGQTIAMELTAVQDLVKKIREASKIVSEKGYDSVLLVSPLIRRAMFNLVSKNIGKISVIASSEIATGYKVESLVLIR